MRVYEGKRIKTVLHTNSNRICYKYNNIRNSISRLHTLIHFYYNSHRGTVRKPKPIQFHSHIPALICDRRPFHNITYTIFRTAQLLTECNETKEGTISEIAQETKDILVSADVINVFH